VLLRGNGATPTETFTAVGQVLSVGKAGSKRDLIDASAHGDDWKDYVLGQQDGDEVALTIALDPADSSQDGIKDDYDAATRRNYQLEHEESTFHVQFPVLVTAFARGGEREGLLEIEATFKIVEPGVQDIAGS
jgi:hypothetical protein